MDKIIIGLVGEIAAGKDTVATELADKHNAQVISFSQPLHDILQRLFFPPTRRNLVDLQMILRQKFGLDLLARVVAKEIKLSDKRLICLLNIQLASDIEMFRDQPGFFLVHVQADPEVRYQRLINCEQYPGDSLKSWEEFLADSQTITEVAGRELAKKADFTINNSCLALEELNIIILSVLLDIFNAYEERTKCQPAD